ncbi:hypothetical protein SEA_CRISPICOUS1_60 [Mycobacterium phage Crispicous1]|nr:hypothetical protein SEA_CRISPICOUS1_60 [Mycobacterium phage Crispicous1]
MPELTTVHGFPDYIISDDGRVFRELKPDITELGYRRFTLYKNGIARKVEGARAVLSSFVEPPPFHKAEAAHLDGDPTNNHVTNLQWKTHIDNLSDRLRHGTLLIGERNPNAKMTDAQAMEALDLYFEAGWKQNRVARRYGVSAPSIQYLRTESYRLDMYRAAKAIGKSFLPEEAFS